MKAHTREPGDCCTERPGGGTEEGMAAPLGLMESSHSKRGTGLALRGTGLALRGGNSCGEAEKVSQAKGKVYSTQKNEDLHAWKWQVSKKKIE